MSKTYSEMIQYSTFEERFLYLKQDGVVGDRTFGGYRELSQKFYKSFEWERIKSKVILRDFGCDLGIKDRPVVKIGNEHIIVHHINPLDIQDIINGSWKLFDLENLVCMSSESHRALHYGSLDYLTRYDFAERKPNDTIPWKR